MLLYKTIANSGKVETTINRSKFIAHIKPISSYEEGQDFVSEIKAEYKDATHNVPAIVFGKKQELQWMSDDGEPQGTAGPPILKVLVEKGLTNLAVVVTRYFGGIKLGTGGLVRAYQGIVIDAIDEIGIAEAREGVLLEYEIDYTHLTKLHKASESMNFSLQDKDFSDKVLVQASCEIEFADQVKTVFSDISSGKCRLLSEESVIEYRKI